MTEWNPIEFLTECKNQNPTIEMIEQNRTELLTQVMKMPCRISDYGPMKYGVFCFDKDEQTDLPGATNVPAELLTDPGPFTGTANQRENHKN